MIFIHIDPSVDPHGTPSQEDALRRLFELYAFCNEKALSLGKKVMFEIGTEEQSGGTNTPEDLIDTLEKVTQYCTNSKFPSSLICCNSIWYKSDRNEEYWGVSIYPFELKVSSQFNYKCR